MEFRAQARFMRVSPQKARLVLNLIKGRKVEDALNTLVFTKKRVALTVEKLLRSALENANYLSAEKGLDVDVDNLYVKKAVANDGPRMKRIRPAPMGRAYRYVRRIAHIELVLAERGKQSEGVANVMGEESAAGKRAGEEGRRQEGTARQRRSRGSKGHGGEACHARRSKTAAASGTRRTSWDKKFIRTDFGSATPSRGSRAGLSRRTTTSCCSKTLS